MINVAIVEDERSAAELLESYFARFSKERGEQFRTVWFENPINFIEGYSANYDLIMMDIEMPDMNGMEVSRKLRERDSSVTLIFVTNMAQFAVKGYEVDASDFIVKPVSYFDFALKLDRVIGRIHSRTDIKIAVSSDDSMRCLLAADITYVEVIKHRLIYHTVNGNVETYGSMRQVEPLLEKAGFIKCNNCYLVNPRFVTAIKGFTAVVAGDELQISHPKRRAFVTALNDYLGGGGK